MQDFVCHMRGKEYFCWQTLGKLTHIDENQQKIMKLTLIFSDSNRLTASLHEPR